MQNKITGIIAPKGSGKTFTVCNLLRGARCFAVFDMLGEFQYAKIADEVYSGTPRAFGKALMQERFRIVYRPTVFLRDDSSNSGERVPEFETFIDCCYLRGNMTCVIDEAHQLCSPHHCPESLLVAIRLGRHRSLDIVYVTQSWSAVSRPLTAATDEFVFFKIIEPLDLQGIRNRCGEEVRDRVQGLRKLEQLPDGSAIPGQRLTWNVTEGMVSVTE